MIRDICSTSTPIKSYTRIIDSNYIGGIFSHIADHFMANNHMLSIATSYYLKEILFTPENPENFKQLFLSLTLKATKNIEKVFELFFFIGQIQFIQSRVGSKRRILKSSIWHWMSSKILSNLKSWLFRFAPSSLHFCQALLSASRN